LSVPQLKTSEHYTAFVDLFFIVVVTLGVQKSIDLFASPLSLPFLFLVTAFVIIGLSWVFYHESTDKLPYTGFRESSLRFFWDCAIAFSYIFLILNVNNYTQFTFVVSIVYLLYWVHGYSTVWEFGWFRGWPPKPTSAPNLWLVFSLIFVLFGYASWYFVTVYGVNGGGIATFLLVLLGVGTSRFLRHSHRVRDTTQNFAEKIHLQGRPAIALDIDGVLAEQVPHVLERAEKEMGVKMKKEDITAWDTPVGGIPFDKLIARYLLDAEFVASMPVVEGAVHAVKTIRGKYPTGVASSRPKETETETVKWLTDNFGMKADRFTNTTGTDKSLIDANILVDDYPPNLKSFIAKSRNRRGILFSQPWNTQHDEIAELIQKGSIVVRKSWEEIESLFQ